MKKTRKYTYYIYPFFLWVTSGIGIFIIIENLNTGIYNINQDSIGLPIGAIIIACLALTAAQLLQSFLHKALKKHHCIRILTTSSLVATSSLILASSIFYWLIPNHITISVFYGFTTIVFIALQMQLLKTLR